MRIIPFLATETQRHRELLGIFLLSVSLFLCGESIAGPLKVRLEF